MCKTRFGSQGVILEEKKLKKTLRELETTWKLSILFFSLPPKFKPISTATFANAFGIWKEKVMCSTMRIMQFLIMMSRRMIMMICCHYSYCYPASVRSTRAQRASILTQGLLTTDRVPQWGWVKIFIKKQTPAIGIIIVKNGHFYPKICFLEHA